MVDLININMEKTIRSRMLTPKDCIDTKVVYLLENNHISNIILTPDNFCAQVLHLPYENNENTSPLGLNYYLVRCIRNANDHLIFHTCTCEHYAHVKKEITSLFGRPMLFSDECSHILAVKHHPLYYRWLYNEEEELPDFKLKDYAIHDNLSLEIYTQMPLEEKGLEKMEFAQNRVKTNIREYFQRKKELEL